jgi:twitching motility protein PilT
MTGRIADRIIDPSAGNGETIEELIADGDYNGMQTFDQSLFALYKNGKIALREALTAATKPHDLKIAMQTAGVLDTT